MASGYKYQCDQFFCGYSFTTSGSWEFYRDKVGKLRQYGHPQPLSEEAKASGVWGYYEDRHCFDCDHKVEVIVSEISNRFREKGVVWKARWLNRIFSFMLSNKYRLESKKNLRCPYCSGGRVFITVPDGIKCPRCEKGSLKGGREWVC